MKNTHLVSLRAPLATLFLVLGLFFNAPALQASLLKETTLPNNFGVNAHFLVTNLENHVVLLKEAGFGWVRRDLDWSSVEKQEGVYDFTNYDIFIDALNKAGIRVLFILDYANPLYDSGLSPYTNIGRTAFTKFVEAAAQRYAKKNVAWEIYNEPNIGFWRPSPHVDNYVALAREVTAVLRKTVPHQAILAPALAGPSSDKKRLEADYAYLSRVLSDKVAASWDGISIHPYRAPKSPETVYEDIPRLNNLLKQHNISAPIIFTEWGYNTSDKGVDEDTQANYAVRSLLISSALRAPFSIWYSWQEAGSDTSESEQKYGFLRNGRIVDPEDTSIRKPAFHAVRELITALRGYRFDKIISDKNGVYNLRFKKGRTMAYAIWTTDKEDCAYDLTLPKGNWIAHAILGDDTAIEMTAKEVTSIKLGSMPVLVIPAER